MEMYWKSFLSAILLGVVSFVVVANLSKVRAGPCGTGSCMQSVRIDIGVGCKKQEDGRCYTQWSQTAANCNDQSNCRYTGTSSQECADNGSFNCGFVIRDISGGCCAGGGSTPPVNQPPPSSGGGGGCDAGCGGSGDCGGGLSCQSRGGKNVCWGSACEPPPPPPTCGSTTALASVNGGTYTASDITIKYGDQLCFKPSPISPNRTSAMTRSGDGWTGSTCSSAPGSPAACPNCITWSSWYGPPGSVSQHWATDATGLEWWQMSECRDVQNITCANIAPTFTSTTETVSGLSAILSWVLNSWGSKCTGNVNQYKVYVDGILVTTQNTSSLTSLYTYTGTAGPHSWYVVATNGALTATSSTRPFTLTAPSSSWFQVVGGDVVAAGDISVSGPGVPAGNKFLASPNAAMIYAGNTSGITAAQVDGWQVNASVASVVQKNTYAKFKIRITNRIVPKTISSFDLGDLSASCTAPETDGACYFMSSDSSEITLPAQTVSKKIVLLVDGTSGNLKVGGNVSISGGGLLVVLAANNITLAGTVSSLQGIYLADKIFSTGVSNTALQVDGTVVGLGNVTLARTFASATTPAEKFIYNPGYISILPATLYEQSRQWQEFAP